jgi:hypothetical protein
LFRRQSVRKLLIEAAVIVIGIGATITIAYYKTRPTPVHIERRLAGHEQDVSRNPRVQYAPALAVGPAPRRLLLGGSSDSLSDTRVYASTDAGSTWQSDPGPPLQRANCEIDHPAVAVTADGTQVFAFSATRYCDLPEPEVQVAVRRRSDGEWRIRSLLPVKGYAKDDHFALATSGKRMWLAWTRRPKQFSSTLVGYVASSSDDGATWSRPVRLPVAQPFALSLAAARDTLYVAAADGDDNTLVVTRSTDGGTRFARPRTLASFTSPYDESCEGAPLPPQPQYCVPPSVHLLLDRDGSPLVGWSDVEQNQTDAVRLARLSPSLRVVDPPHRIGPADGDPSDQFDLSLALDPSDGTLWACYMDTFGDVYRHEAWPTCTLSRDHGRSWASPVRVALAASDETKTGSNLRGYGSTALAAWNGVGHVLWTDTRRFDTLGEEIYAATVPAGALLHPPTSTANK